MNVTHGKYGVLNQDFQDELAAFLKRCFTVSLFMVRWQNVLTTNHMSTVKVTITRNSVANLKTKRLKNIITCTQAVKIINGKPLFMLVNTN